MLISDIRAAKSSSESFFFAIILTAVFFPELCWQDLDEHLLESFMTSFKRLCMFSPPYESLASQLRKLRYLGPSRDYRSRENSFLLLQTSK